MSVLNERCSRLGGAFLQLLDDKDRLISNLTGAYVGSSDKEVLS